MLGVEFVEKIELATALLFRGFLMWQTDCVSVSGELVKWKSWIWLFSVVGVVGTMGSMGFAGDSISKSMGRAFSSSNNSVFHKLSISKVLD